MPPNGFGWVFAEWKRTGQRGRMPNSLQLFLRIFVVKKTRISDLVTKIGIIFVGRDSLGLRATANSSNLSYGSLIVKIKTLPMADAAAARPPVLYLALCIVRYGRTFASKVCTRRFRKRATSTHLYWKIKYELHFDIKMIFSLIYIDHRFDRSPFL